MPPARPPGHPAKPEKDLVELHDAWNPSQTQLDVLEANGVTVRRGKWSADEAATLAKNMNSVAVVFATDDLDTFANSLKKKSPESTKLYRMLAEGIDRPLQAVYRRFMREVVDGKGERYTAEQVVRLKKLQKLHGNDFKKIGEQMGRSATSVRDRLRAAQAFTKGWTAEEEGRLRAAVLKATAREPTELIQSHVPWETVAKEMAPRAPHQCQAKWLSKVAWMSCGAARDVPTKWTAADDHALVKHVIAAGCANDEDIDWNHLALTFPGTIRTGHFLRVTWRRLVARERKKAAAAANGTEGAPGTTKKTKPAVDATAVDEGSAAGEDAAAAADPADEADEAAAAVLAAMRKAVRKELKKTLGRVPKKGEVKALMRKRLAKQASAKVADSASSGGTTTGMTAAGAAAVEYVAQPAPAPASGKIKKRGGGAKASRPSKRPKKAHMP